MTSLLCFILSLTEIHIMANPQLSKRIRLLKLEEVGQDLVTNLPFCHMSPQTTVHGTMEACVYLLILW